jgi:hypothetical protein
MTTTQRLLERYAKAQSKVDELSHEADVILESSPLGQAPPVFHRIVKKMLKITEERIAPIWDELRNRVIPGSGFHSYWQETKWTFGTLPPHYSEIERATKKFAPSHSNSITKVEEPEMKARA